MTDRSPIKAGELCFLCGCIFHKENNGHPVVTIKPYVHEVTKQTGWLCEAISPLRVQLHWANGTTAVGKQKEFFARTDQLIPIRDNDGETDEISRVRENSKIRKNDECLSES